MAHSYASGFTLIMGNPTGLKIVIVSLQLWHQTNDKKRVLDKMPYGSKKNCHSWPNNKNMYEVPLVNPHGTNLFGNGLGVG